MVTAQKYMCAQCFGTNDVRPDETLEVVLMCKGCRFKLRQTMNFLAYHGYEVVNTDGVVAETNPPNPPESNEKGSTTNKKAT